LPHFDIETAEENFMMTPIRRGEVLTLSTTSYQWVFDTYLVMLAKAGIQVYLLDSRQSLSPQALSGEHAGMTR
jgi:hypothetical protein